MRKAQAGWTGQQIAELRSALGMNVQQFAQLLGVHLATVYRWEAAGPDVVRVEALQMSLLTQLQRGLGARRARERQAWVDSILRGLLVGGTLVALAVLLQELLPEDQQPSRQRSRRRNST